jgi:uncharacterized membrane protein YphA (DoxX/SURF4 family)
MNKDKILSVLSWFPVIITFILAFFISKNENYNLAFLIILILNLIGAMGISKFSNKSVLMVVRIAVGMLFIYSGFVKGVDPLGTQYRIEDYFYAFNLTWAVPIALPLSVLLNAFEFSLGIFLVFNLRMQLVSWLAFLLMLFFTITTLNDALFSPVPDCGCFGDALIISNWQTFYKNIVIFAFVMILFLRRKSLKNKHSVGFQFSFMLISFLIFAIFEIYTIRHQPIIDFRPWKVGNRLIPENPKPAVYYLKYKNSKLNEEKEYLSSELPWQDSIFKADWVFVSTREVNPDAGLYRTFPMMDTIGNDLSNTLASSERPVFLMVVYDITIANKASLDLFAPIFELCKKNGWEFYMLNSNLPEDLSKVVSQNKLPDYPVLNSDDTALKAAIRANPGLIIIQNGIVKHKFNYRDIPEVDELVKIIAQ